MIETIKILHCIAMENYSIGTTQPLKTTQKMMMWFSMCSTDESSTQRQKQQYIVYTSVVLIIEVIGFVASLTYCFKYIITDFDGAAFAFMIGIGDFGLIYIMIAAIQLRQQIANIFESLSRIYKIRKFIQKFETLKCF